jgi:Family of unknown function (DUF5719)
MRSRRFLFVILLGVLVAGALAAGRASSAPSAADPNAAPSAAAISEPSGVWFCPGLPPTLPRRSGRVTFANIGDTAADVVVTDLPDTGRATQVAIKVAANTVVTRSRDQLGGPGALTAETFGGRVLVEEGIEGAQALETSPCATQTSTHSYFAAGTTPRGVQQWLVIDNPYASDAKVDVTLRTSTGVLRPDAIQALDISRRSRVIIPIHDHAVRKDRVAVEVAASLGSVVAAQTLVYTATAGRPGIALSMGSPVAGTDWSFAGATAEPGSSALVAIVNVGDDDAHVDVQATAARSKQALASASITVAPDDVMWLLLGQCAPAATKTPASRTGCVSIPSGVSYSLDVRAEEGVSIVAQTLTRFAATDVVGTVTSPGGVEPANDWAFARSRVRGERSTSLSLLNPGAVPAVVDVGLVHDGIVDRPGALQNVTIPPGRAVTLVVVGGRRPATHDAALVVSANAPIFAERLITTRDEASSAVGAVVRTPTFGNR